MKGSSLSIILDEKKQNAIWHTHIETQTNTHTYTQSKTEDYHPCELILLNEIPAAFCFVYDSYFKHTSKIKWNGQC